MAEAVDAVLVDRLFLELSLILDSLAYRPYFDRIGCFLALCVFVFFLSELTSKTTLQTNCRGREHDEDIHPLSEAVDAALVGTLSLKLSLLLDSLDADHIVFASLASLCFVASPQSPARLSVVGFLLAGLLALQLS